MHVLSLVNEKGGVGKTTLATHIAAGLAIRGQRVLIIDGDPQGHVASSYGLPKEAGLYNLLVRGADFEDVTREIPAERYQAGGRTIKGALWMLPSNVETRVISELLEDVFVLRDRLSEVEDDIDVVVIDTPPTPSLFHSVVYFASDSLIYPTECESLSLDAIAASIEHKEANNVRREREGLRPMAVMGIQPTMYRANTNAHDHGLAQLQKRFEGLMWPAITQRTVWVERAWAQKMIFAYAPESGATTETWALIDRVEAKLA